MATIKVRRIGESFADTQAKTSTVVAPSTLDRLSLGMVPVGVIVEDVVTYPKGPKGIKLRMINASGDTVVKGTYRSDRMASQVAKGDRIVASIGTYGRGYVLAPVPERHEATAAKLDGIIAKLA